MLRSRIALAVLATLAFAPAAQAGDRPPLPRSSPSGPVEDRRQLRLPSGWQPELWTDLPARPATNVNRLLDSARITGEAQLAGAEDIAPGLDGHLYTGTADGGIWRIAVDRHGKVERLKRVATVRGRPLGLDAYSKHVLVAAVADRGLMAIDLRSGRSWVLADRLDGRLIFFADAVSVADDGTIYLSEASTAYPNFLHDLLHGRPNGRLLRYEPRSGRLGVVADGLYFANGVAVAPDERSVLVAESLRFRITRVWLEGRRRGRAEPFGPPLINGADNIRLDRRGRLWVGGSDLRSDATDALLTSAELRRQIAALPPSESGSIRPPYAFAQVLDRDGDPIAGFHGPNGPFTAVSSALPHRGRITFGSLSDRGIAQLRLPARLR